MAFLRKRKSGDEVNPNRMWIPAIDSNLSSPLAAESRARSREGDWRALSGLLCEAQTRDEIGHILDSLPEADTDQPHAWIQEWHAAEPTNGYVSAVLAHQWLQAAWVIRGSGLASTVAEDAWSQVHERTRIAERILAQAYRIDPTNFVVLETMLSVAFAVGIPEPEMWRRYQRATAQDPFSFAHARRAAYYLTPRWHGTEEKVIDFARDLHQRAPEGHPVHAIIPFAYIETAYMADRDLTEWEEREIVSALQRSRLLDGHNLDDPDFIVARNLFIFGLWFANEVDRAAHLMRQLGQVPTRYTESPWHYREDPAVAITLAAIAFGLHKR